MRQTVPTIAAPLHRIFTILESGITSRVKRLLFSMSLIILLSAQIGRAQTLDSVTPRFQRVHELITLRGRGFGSSQGSSQVLFIGPSLTIRSGHAFVWRDDFIQVRVPSGERIGSVNTRIPLTPILVAIDRGGVRSATQSFQVISATTGSLSFRQATNIASNTDTSTVLGSPNLNRARTKNADQADVNGDGYIDLFDNNSNNEENGTHTVLRLNNRDKTFTAIPFDPLSATDSGTFAASIPSGGIFFGDSVSYDADLADLDNDGLPDVIQTQSNDFDASTERAFVRIFMNNRGGVPGRFEEQTVTRIPSFTPPAGRPDDIDFGDINNDGFMDFIVTFRTSTLFRDVTSTTVIFVNDGAGVFRVRIDIPAPTHISTHDAFFIDANNDGFEDVILCHEWNTLASDPTVPETTLYLNNGNPAAPAFTLTRAFGFASSTGEAADLNGDGLLDFAVGQNGARVYLNNPSAAGMFTESILPDSAVGNFYYDLEFGDLNLDGFTDIVGAVLTRTADNTVRVWLNDGNGAFTNRTSPGASALLPNIGPYERLSSEVLDYDLDGDLDLYIAGADGQDVGFGFGAVPNQLYENLLVGLNILTPKTAAPVYAGSLAAGRKVLIRLRADIPIVSLDRTSFTVSVDGVALPPNENVAGALVGGEFWLLEQMPPKASGCYALKIALASDMQVSDEEPQSLCYDTSRAFDRALAIDRTGSMNYDSVTRSSTGEKMIAARDAARFFVDLSADIDRIGVTSFKRDSDDGNGVVEQRELARTDFPMVVAQDGVVDNRVGARSTIGGIAPDGMGFSYETAVGAGLLEAFNMLNDPTRGGDPTHEWEIVLLTDGLENYPPYWRLPGPPEPVAPLIAAASPRVRIHTVGIGRDVSNEVLEDIARSTGGNFWNLIEGTGSFGLASRLANVYKFIDENIRDEQRFFYKEDVPAGLGEMPVEPGLESMTVAFHWNVEVPITVHLLTPDGQVITHAPPDVYVFSDQRHQIFQIRKPMEGVWKYRVAVDQKPKTLEFFTAASGISTVVMRSATGDVHRTLRGTFEIPIRALLADDKPIRSATVIGTIRLPDGSYVRVALRDDGRHTDGREGDGLYGTMFEHNQLGAYSLALEATGRSNRGIQFVRNASFSFVFPGQKLRDEDSDRDGIPDYYENEERKLNPHYPSDAAADYDKDGLSNLLEFRLGTNPLVGDTDGDGRSDGFEAANCTDPLSKNEGNKWDYEQRDGKKCTQDTDRDGLTNEQEKKLGTNPLKADTDGDGFSDILEISLGSDPLNSKSRPRALP